jgi:hypothetical protein
MDSAMEYVVNCACFARRAKYPDPYQFPFDGGAGVDAVESSKIF